MIHLKDRNIPWPQTFWVEERHSASVFTLNFLEFNAFLLLRHNTRTRMDCASRLDG